ncbi:Nn.00g076520.m01.CDS01 [Neocucurbitaria sp. VM-36]
MVLVANSQTLFYETASKFRGKDGWFNEHEEKTKVNRILRDDPSDMHNRQALSLKAIGCCLADYHMWPLYLAGLTWLIPNNPMQAYLTLQLRSVGFKTFETNLLTIPAYALFIAQLLFWTWLSERWNERFFTAMVTSPWVKWALSCLLVGHPYMHAILVALGSRDAGTIRTRTMASALYNMSVQASSIIASNVYRNDANPLYRRGNRVLIGICVYNIFVFIGAKLFYVRVNANREKNWNAMTEEEKQHYLATTTDKVNKRLDFRFAH